MIHTIRAYIEKNGLLQPDGAVIVGVSGGADSVALLHLLVRLNYSCIAAHCNFHLRGEESDRDEAFVKQEAENLHVPFFKTGFHTVEYAERQHISIEMAARDLRYQWFEELRVAHQAQAIAVAHHQDDSVETVLLNLIRGTGIRGLCGIRPKNGYLVRPLLAVSRHEILEWLSQQRLTYQTDSTNLSDEYTRNFIRLRILPLMEELNPSVRNTIARTAGHLSGIETFYLNRIEEERQRIMDDQLRIHIPGLMQSFAPQTVLYELIHPYGFTRTLSDSIFEALQGEPGKIFQAPASSCQIVKDRDYLLLTTKRPKDLTAYPVEPDTILTYPVALSARKVKTDASFEIEKDASVATFDYDKLTFPLTLRKWREGDWFVPFGMKGRQKLSDYFTDHKFSLVQKEQTWLLCNASDIIWIVGERTDERYRIDKSTKYALIAKKNL
ncbi:MAG: tRNA lysidine(34) synthetase TilS [Tannerella sp.]|jgi:tRNA(Ile)-lysidine synthase|nr:tRNA lysidine(34) synthetase TilS [Tannerella sp.]